MGASLVIWSFWELVTAQFVDVLVLADLFVGFGFDLADALSRDAEFFADFFEGVRDAV